VIVACAAQARGALGDVGRAPQFERDVRPILVANCLNCHGVTAPKAELDLRSMSTILRGGKSGPAIVRSDPENSLLYQRVTEREMPPDPKRKLSDQEVAVVRAWIAGGARANSAGDVAPPVQSTRNVDRRFWSFRRVVRPEVPSPKGALAAGTPIDAFLLARLQAKGLTFAPEAAPLTLVRRAYLDLLGVPPSPEEADAFALDPEPGAFERLVDRLLASPHYGDRWGRHWLDVAGYVDTVGFDTDATNIITSEGKWLYRDYVIGAMNEDKPFDEFVTEQLAGDELHDWRRARHLTREIRDALVATGYLRTARDLTHEDVGVIPQNFHGIVHDTLEIVGTGLLGLTINCARCHDHKFDPVPQEDYYRLKAIFTPAYNPRAWLPVIPFEPKIKDRSLPDVSPAELAEIEKSNTEVDRRVEALNRQLSALYRPHEEQLVQRRLGTLPEVIREDVNKAVGTPPEKRTPVQKYLAEKFAGYLTFKPEEVAASLNATEKTAAAGLNAKIAATASGRRKWDKIQALYDVGNAPPTYLLVRGNEQTPGQEVAPGFLRVLCGSEVDALAKEPAHFAGTSGRRTALARWLTRTDSAPAALLARVMVNRVWKQLFGQGIVPSQDNFGAQGQRPTHPELLEWLSAEFIAGGWRLKPLVKLMVTSRAYRQASHRDGGKNSTAVNPEVVDPGDELLWRMRLRRLEAEAVRDSILAASGDLDQGRGGPPVMISARPDGLVAVARDRQSDPSLPYRRSVYLLTRRAYNLSLLSVFDQPVIATNCLKRGASALPLQSLFMINDAFLAEEAAHFARRVKERGGTTSSPEKTIELAFRMALVRRPNARETATCAALLRQQTERGLSSGLAPDDSARYATEQLCLTLLNTSEFLFAE
jgi:hypothetical protein